MLDEAIALHKAYAAAHFNKGIAHTNLHPPNHWGAIEAFTDSLALNPNDERVRPLLGSAMLSYAKSLMSTDASEAEQYLSRAMHHINDSIAHGSKNPRTLHLRCELGDLLGYKAQENLSFCTSALNTNGEKWAPVDRVDADVTLNLLGVISKKMQQHTAAIKYFSRGLDKNPQSYDLLVNLATTHSDTGNHELANIYFEQAEALDIKTPLLRAYLFANKGWDMEKQGMRLAAYNLYQQAINLSQPHPHPQFVANLHNIEQYCKVSKCE